jgi:Domain of unknown function (DUF4189)
MKITYGASVVLTGAAVAAAGLGFAPTASATANWVAISASPSSNKFDVAPGSTSDEAQQNVMSFCQSKGHPDCTYVISGQQCVAAMVVNNQAFGGVGATNKEAESAAENAANSATGATQMEGDSGCVTDF